MKKNNDMVSDVEAVELDLNKVKFGKLSPSGVDGEIRSEALASDLISGVKPEEALVVYGTTKEFLIKGYKPLSVRMHTELESIELKFKCSGMSVMSIK